MESLNIRILDGPHSSAAKEVAFTRIYNHLTSKLLKKISPQFSTPEDAEDTVQEIMQRVWHYSTYSGVPFRSALWRISQSTTSNAVSDQRIRPQTEPIQLHEAEAHRIPSREDVPEARITYLESLHALRALSDDYLDILELLSAGYDYQEITERYNISEGAARVKVHRVRKAAQRALEAADLPMP